MQEKYFDILIKLAEKAAKKDEVPVSALIVKDNKVVAKAINKNHSKKNALYHAEMLVIDKTSRKYSKNILDDCDLYVTLKPCSMCEGAIRQARIKNVYYLLEKPENKKEYYKTNYKKANISMQEEYSKILKNFFQNKRDKRPKLWYNI